MKKIILPVLLITIIYIGNRIFNRMELKNASEPVTFQFVMPDKKLLGEIAHRYKIPAAPKI